MASGSIAGQSYSGQYFYFNWSSSYHSPGVSLISWRLSGQGGSSYWYNSQCYLNINGSRVYNRGLQSTYFKNNTYSSGSFYVYHNSSGAAYFNASIISSIYNHALHTRSNNWAIYGNYPYTSCGAPSSVSIASTDGEVKPGVLQISWNAGSAGTANSIKGYGVFLGKNYIPTASKYDKYFEVGNTQSAEFDMGSLEETDENRFASRGDTIYATIRTHGTAGGSYYSGASGAYGSAHIVNYAISPDVMVTEDRLTSKVTTGEFFLSAIGSSANALQYKIDNGEWENIAEGDIKKLNLEPGTMKKITARARNILGEWNLEKHYKEARIMRNSEPEIIIKGIKTNSYFGENNFKLEDGTNKEAIITDYHYETDFELKPGKFSLDEQSYIKVYCKWKGNETYEFPLDVSADLKEAPFGGISGSPFKIYYKYYDGVEIAKVKESEEWYVLPISPKTPTAPIITNIRNEKAENNTAENNELLVNKEFSFTYHNTKFELGQLYNLNLEVLASIGSSISLIKEFENIETTGELKVNLEDIEGFPRGTDSKLSFRLKDDAANSSGLFESPETLKRVNLPYFHKNSKLTISPKNLKPFSTKENLVLTNPIGEVFNKSSRRFEYFFGPNVSSIGEGKINGSTATKIIQVANSKDDKDPNKINLFIDEYAEEDVYKSIFNTKYEVRLYDDFNNFVSLFETNTTDFKEPPFFENGNEIEHIIQYSSTKNYLVPKGEEDYLRKAYNKDENVLLKFAKPSDYNKDMKEYEVYKANIIIDGDPKFSLNQNYDTLNYTLIKKENYKTSEGNEETIQLDIPYYENNCYTVVKIVAVDNIGQQSNPIYSNTHLIACRTGKPLIYNTDLTFNTKDNTFTPKLIIEDIGGSKLPNFSFADSYAKYPNFERTGSIFKEISLILELCTDAEFNGVIDSYVNTFTEEYKNIQSYINTPFVLGDKYKTLSQFYVRFSITIDTGYGKKVNYITPIQIFYNESPTISRRNHTIGINTKEFSSNNNEALLVSDYQEKKYITLSGTSDDGLLKKVEVQYNLKTGEVTGGIIIDGGEW